jgi:hypothetical protein
MAPTWTWYRQEPSGWEARPMIIQVRVEECERSVKLENRTKCAEWFGDEAPQRQVFLDPFYIDRY